MSEDTGFTTQEVRETYAGRSTVRLETVRTPDGEDLEREVVDHDDAVAVVPVTDDGRVVLLRQYRQPLRGHLLEIPAGTLDDAGESFEAAAGRELAEEVEPTAREPVHLITFANSAGWSTERTHVYLGRGTTPSPAPDGFTAHGEEAEMEVVVVAFEEAVRAARAGDLVDAKTVVGLLLAAAWFAGVSPGAMEGRPGDRAQ